MTSDTGSAGLSFCVGQIPSSTSLPLPSHLPFLPVLPQWGLRRAAAKSKFGAFYLKI